MNLSEVRRYRKLSTKETSTIQLQLRSHALTVIVSSKGTRLLLGLTTVDHHYRNSKFFSQGAQSTPAQHTSPIALTHISD